MMETNEFDRARTDKKEYRLYELPNGLEVLLVSDQTQPPSDDNDDDDESEPSQIHEENEDYDDDEEEEDDDEEAGLQHGGCAVAMAVNCGSYHESDQDPCGLAHLLEHMLFMGSEKYPDENAYDDYLSKHGGYSNAYTEAEHTMYYFDVGSSSALPQAMDIFAQFFIAPLMKADSLEREIQAVDSEFDLTIADDELRMRALWHTPPQPCCKHHPFHRFGWGNKQSLMADDDTEKLQAQLRAFYAKHYQTNNMKLVVWSTDDLDTIQLQVNEIFEKLPMSMKPPPPLLEGYPPALEQSQGNVYRIIPVNDVHTLRLTWQHTPQLNYKSKPWSYLAHLIGHESQGGLLDYLKKKHWATEVWAGTSVDDGEENNSLLSLFAVDVKLTSSGMDNVNEVIESVYAYIGMLKREGVVIPWVFEEIAYIAKIAFEFRDDGEPSDQACELASKLLRTFHLEDKRDLFTCDLLMFDCNEKDVLHLMQSLGIRGNTAPRIDLASSKFGREADITEWHGETERYWKTKFTHEPIPNELVERCELAMATANNTAFKLPPKNHYIPFEGLEVAALPKSRVEYEAQNLLCNGLLHCKVEIQVTLNKNKKEWLSAEITKARKRDNEQQVECLFVFETGDKTWFVMESTAQEYEERGLYVFSSHKVRVLTPPHLAQAPTLSLNNSNSGIRFWTLQDSIFKVPRSALFCLLNVGPNELTLQQRVLADLLCNVCMHQVMSHNIYLAKMAELDLKIRFQEQERGFSIRVLGFSPKVVILVKEAIENLMRLLRDPQCFVTQEVFAFEKEAMLRHYVNMESELDVQANAVRLRALVRNFSKQELQSGLEQLEAMPQQVGIQVCAVECLYHGNVDQREASKAVKSITPLVNAKQQLGARLPRGIAFAFPRASQSYLLFPANEQSEKTAALQMYFQLCEETPRNLAVCESLESLLEEPFFNELRTKQQVGYVVSCSLRRTRGTIGIAFDVSSSKFALFELVAKVERFLQGFKKETMSQLDEEELRYRCRAVRKRMLQKDSGIFEETKRLWVHILDQGYSFLEHFAVAHELAHQPKPQNRFGVQVREVQRMFDEAFSFATRRLLVVGVVGGANEVTSMERELANVPAQLTLYDTLEAFWNQPAAKNNLKSPRKYKKV